MTTALPFAGTELLDHHRAAGWLDLPDAVLVGRVAQVVALPRQQPADSFVLHAPLELAARAGLLPFVDPGRRPRARARIAAIAAQYEAFGPEVAPSPAREFISAPEAATYLARAVAAGDLDAVDAAAAWIGRATTPAELAGLLADSVIPSLAAAAHAPIFLHLLPRVAPRGELTGELLRPLARELARQPTWQLTWQLDRPAAAGPLPVEELLDAVGATPRLGVPGSTFIYPTMHQVESTGVAERLLAVPTRGVDVRAGGQALLRTAAACMVTEPDDHAPYGWSHALTMPQAVLALAGACADASTALAVAATYIVGFRAALATRPLATQPVLDDPRLDPREALDGPPAAAAAAFWHASEHERAGALIELLSRAAIAHDAHLVKYTLACLDAAASDPGAARLYLSAAAYLVAYWGDLSRS